MTGDTYRTDQLDMWRSYFDRLESTGPYHAPDYLALLERYFGAGDETAELFVYGDDDAFVYYPYLLRDVSRVPFSVDSDLDPAEYTDVATSWYYGGPLCSPGADGDLITAFREAFHQHCRDAGIVAEFVRYDPNLGNHRTFDVMPAEFDRQTVTVDLTQSEAELWDGFEKRNRNAIRQGQDSILSVEPTSDRADYQRFHEIYSNAMEARDASNHYRFGLEFFVDLLADPDRATLLVARDGEDVVGGSMVVHDAQIAHDYIRASNPDYWDQRVNNLLCYEAMMHMRETDRRLFDFQGGRPGVFRFKKAFSPDRREFYIGKEIHLEPVYDQLIEAAAASGIDTDKDYFPAYRIQRSN